MSSRREFLGCALAAGGVAAWGRARAATREPLRILVLGGTGNVGPYHVKAAVERGHRVSVFTRGKTHADLPSPVERLIGDRNGDLASISNRQWDAVIDIATFGPAWVRSLGLALGRKVGHYTFISTVSVYDQPSTTQLTSEDAPALAYTGREDPYSVIEHIGPDYGALKVLCEREAEKQFPGRTLVLRPGYIGGPGDSNRMLTYWVARAKQGGEMLASDDPATPVQFIDVRDMAEWAIRMIEKRATGTYNAVGPAAPTTLAQLVDAASASASPRPAVTWVPSPWLGAQKNPELWGTLFFWSRGVGNIMRMSNQKALASGLTTRPLRTTLADMRHWYQLLPAVQRETFTTGYRKKDDGSGFEAVITSWPEYLAREKEMLMAWRAAAAVNRR